MRTSTSMLRRANRWAATIALLAGLGLLTACSGSDSKPEATPTPTPSAATSSSDEPDPKQQGDAEDASSDQSSEGDSGTRPSITSFSTPENIDCHNGNFQNFSASWHTKNATKTTLSIDGGLYDTYGKSADVSLPFNCSSPHKFVLTAIDSAGHKASKSITLHPRNVQTDNGDDDEGDEEDN